MRRTMPLAAPLALAGALLVAVPAHAAESLPVAAVTASDDDGNVPANTLEGDLATRWSAEGDGVWIRFDLGAAAPVGSVGLAWHKGDSRRSTFQVQASTDGNAWTTVVAQRQSGGGAGELRLHRPYGPVRARRRLRQHRQRLDQCHRGPDLRRGRRGLCRARRRARPDHLE